MSKENSYLGDSNASVEDTPKKTPEPLTDVEMQQIHIDAALDIYNKLGSVTIAEQDAMIAEALYHEDMARQYDEPTQ